VKAKKTPWKKKKVKSFSFSTLLGSLLVLGLLGYFVYVLGTGASRQKQLEATTTTTYAVVIDEKNYFGNSPVSHQFSYSFEFTVAGKKYTGNTGDSNCQVGDIIRIKYVPANPTFNEKVDSE
jgi:flagellar basal body-associated protein FliL